MLVTPLLSGAMVHHFIFDGTKVFGSFLSLVLLAQDLSRGRVYLPFPSFFLYEVETVSLGS